MGDDDDDMDMLRHGGAHYVLVRPGASLVGENTGHLGAPKESVGIYALAYAYAIGVDGWIVASPITCHMDHIIDHVTE